MDRIVLFFFVPKNVPKILEFCFSLQNRIAIL
nr:MAG TPA_asm: hypothetical protein [Bacteriophage sp.]